MVLLNKSKLKVVDQEVLLFYKYFTLFEILVETIDKNPGGGGGGNPASFPSPGFEVSKI